MFYAKFYYLQLVSQSIEGLIVKKLTKKISIATFALLMASSASAVTITSDLTITGEVSFDDNPSTGSLPAIGDATQTAIMESILGGTSSTSTVTMLR